MEEDSTRQQSKDSSSSSDDDTAGTDITWPSSTETDADSIHSEQDSPRENALSDSYVAGRRRLHEDYQRKDCPALRLELAAIDAAYPTLRSTGCTERFCQSGRMIRLDEPRVGRDLPVHEMHLEARTFLRQLRDDGVINSDEEFHIRLENVLKEITSNAANHGRRPDTRITRKDKCTAFNAGGTWIQTIEELKHGLRLAWKHSSKCIMRSEYETLEVIDLRHVDTSQAMCSTLVDALKKAFNNGKITPTVFVFPPRQPGKRGPMFWNSQLLSFAAYEQEDGEVLGDPANLQLTKDIMQLGWKPPRLRSRWDLLPVVAMAEGDDPFIHELTPSDFPLVRILHPGHELQFEKLGLRWVPAPALSRLGFDIGGVQYTATPFIGWFMDAEIGVRNLADTFRYNALPQVAAALGWVETEHEIDRLPEYERLAVLSRAQTELNFAVFHSFKSSGVAMSDTLSASTMYCNYDDEHFRSKGYRLPSNPYWLAPPQGSIVPIWHRGGTPNYQPSPLVCRHVQDPVKAWRREQQSRISGTSIDRRSGFRHSSAITCPRASPQTCAPVDLNGESESETKPKIFICFCSAASTAKKLAEDLHKRLRRRVENKFSLHPVKPLNDLNFHKMSSSDTLLIIASTAGHGEVPLNGQRFLKTSIDGEAAAQISFSIFGNGSSMYGDRYNAAAKAIRDHLVKLDLRPIGDGLYAGDTAEEDPPWTQFEEWFRQLLEALHVEPQQLQGQSSQQRAGPKPKDWTEVVSTYSTAKLVDCRRTHASGIQHVRLDIGEQCYETLSHVSVLVPNDSAIVKRALRTIGLNGKELVWSIRGQDLTVKEFLTAFVDFERPFSNIDWARSWDFSPSQRRLIRELPVRESLQAFTWPWRGKVAITALVSAMPLKTPRIFSAASSQDLLGRQGKGQQLELLIQHRENGLVSDFLKKARSGARLRLCTTQLEDKTLLERVSGPVICFATGSGLALVLSLLKHRVLSRTGPRVSEESRCNPQSIDRESHSKQEAITLILGFRGCDSDIICQDLQEPIDEGVIDMLLMTPSNDQKLRAQDRVFESNVRDRIEEKLRCNATAVLVCALPEAAGEFARNLSAIVGCNIQESLGDRYIEQTYKPAC